MFARTRGSAEMPSAARPFTPTVVETLRQRGVTIAPITLHCGVSSFEAPERPPMERFAVPHTTAKTVSDARRTAGRVIAVGTTVVRALESSMLDGRVVASSGWTDLVIDARHRVRSVDGLLTGFHEPAATHLWLLESFLDSALLNCAYAEAADRGYRYHEFGDVHLIL
jgi:S-adenosylmethionine:tRNA ribosyltransferase-isomerase